MDFASLVQAEAEKKGTELSSLEILELWSRKSSNATTAGPVYARRWLQPWHSLRATIGLERRGQCGGTCQTEGEPWPQATELSHTATELSHTAVSAAPELRDHDPDI